AGSRRRTSPSSTSRPTGRSPPTRCRRRSSGEERLGGNAIPIQDPLETVWFLVSHPLEEVSKQFGGRETKNRWQQAKVEEAEQRSRRSRQHLVDDVPMYVRQAALDAVVVVRQPLVIEAEQVQH